MQKQELAGREGIYTYGISLLPLNVQGIYENI